MSVDGSLNDSPSSTTTTGSDSKPSDSAKIISQVLEDKAVGNANHKAGKISEAVGSYSKGIDRLDGVTDESLIQLLSDCFHNHLPMLLCNRSLCHIKLENFGSAVIDATRAIELSRTRASRSKAYFRRGTAHLCLTKYDAAVRDFKSALRLEPSDAVLERRLNEATKLLTQQKFAEAIRADVSVPISQTIDVDSYALEPSFTGPIYEGPESLSPKFFLDVVEFLKEPRNRLQKRCILRVALDIIAAYKTEPNIVGIDVPDSEEDFITVCGDVHGQFYDLLSIFAKNGWPSTRNRYLFNGDFVDRGSFSVEVILTLYLAKLVWPEGMFLTRGNHESRRMTKLYGFEGEMRAKASSTIYDVYCESFDHLPLAHCINNRIFVVHGGLSTRKGITLEDINKLDRCGDEEEGLLSDLLWADPQHALGCAPSKRGVSNTFGPDVTKDFLETNNLEMVIRSHEMKEGGYEICHDGQLITVFSAPNYCDQMGNKGSYMKFSGKVLNDRAKPVQPVIHVFEDVPHPPVRAMQYANPVFLGS